MLSILIPTYNYNVYPLVLELNKQCLECEIDFEIIVIDDDSNQFKNENQKINSVDKCFFSTNNSNLGRGRNINFLAEKAQFEWLLIIDCDTFPTKNNFIQKYISETNEKEKVVFGGIEYQKEKPKDDQLLRWVYGNARESLSVKNRNTNPNENALTSNLLIRKDVFISNKFDESITEYGYEDLVFLSDLKKKNIIVKHIDNPTYHLGLETSQRFLDKTKIALENLVFIIDSKIILKIDSKIITTYNLLDKLKLKKLTAWFFNKTETAITGNLLSANPSILLFDLYKLGYFCKIKSN